MPAVPNDHYPVLNTWDAFIYILSNDTSVIEDLSIENGDTYSGLALYTLPLTQETIVFSDTGKAVSIWYKTEKKRNTDNRMETTIAQFYCDIACQNEDLTEVIRMVEKLDNKITYTLELNQDLVGEDGEATASSMEITETNPVGPPDKAVLWSYIARLDITAVLYGMF